MTFVKKRLSERYGMWTGQLRKLCGISQLPFFAMYRQIAFVYPLACKTTTNWRTR